MASTLTSANVKSALDWVWSDAVSFGNTRNVGGRTALKKFVTGTAGALDANKVYAGDGIAVGAAGTTTLSLFGGTLTDFAGDAIVFTKVKAVLVELLTGPASVAVRYTGNTLRTAAYGSTNANDVLVYLTGFYLLCCPTAAGLAVGADGVIDLINAGAAGTANVIILGVG